MALLAVLEVLRGGALQEDEASPRLCDNAALEETYEALQQGDPKRSEPIIDYLNFFEFIAGLWVMKKLSKEEICRLFDYYLRLIVRRPVVHEFVRSQGFENLDRLLSELRTTNA